MLGVGPRDIGGTHTVPDLECYADRILYLRNGSLESQALNTVQTPLDYDRYVRYLNNLDLDRK